ncbi:MAG: PEGA domain-containing protein [Myxococcota bacterium]
MRQAVSSFHRLALAVMVALVGHGRAVEFASAAAPTSRTNVDSVPTGASVFLMQNGVESLIGVTPLKLFRLPRGLVQLKFKKDGYEDSVQNLTIAARVDTFVFTLTRSIQPATVELISAGEFQGATVEVDGKAVGPLPTTTKVPPGRHQVVITKDGYARWERWIDASEGQKVTFDVVMTKNEAPKGAILVTSNPSGADVRVNGKPQGKTPTLVQGLDAGANQVEIALPDYDAFSQTVAVEPGKNAVLDAQLKKTKGDDGDLKVLTSGADGMMVLLDGEEIGLAPLTKTGVRVGTHQVEAKNKDGFYGSATAEVKAGELTVVRVTVAQTGTPTTSSVRVAASRPGGTVRVDNGEAKPLPADLQNLEPGTHVFTVHIDGFADWVKTVSLKPGANEEIVAQVEQAGRIEVRTKDGKSTGQVFVDGKPIGTTPFIGDLPAGTHQLLVQRDDGAQEEFQIAVAPDRVVKVAAAFGADKPKVEAKHRPMPFSARALSAGTGAVNLVVSWPGWPFPISARAGGGVGHGFDINVEARSAFDVINELELIGKWMFLDTGTLAVAVETGLGAGLGGSDRSSFVWRVNAKGSLMIGEKAAITLRLGTLFHSDHLGPKDENKGSDRSDSGLRFYLGLGIEFRITDGMNFLVNLEGDPVGSKRFLYEASFLDDPDPKIYASFGLSIMF